VNLLKPPEVKCSGPLGEILRDTDLVREVIDVAGHVDKGSLEVFGSSDLDRVSVGDLDVDDRDIADLAFVGACVPPAAEGMVVTP
jgi:hypothetical protein